MNSLSVLEKHSLLLVRGPDARKFLQGQVTCDIESLFTSNISPLGAHCTHKGRMVFTFRAAAWDHETVALNIPSDSMQNAIAALGKYIVFSKAELLHCPEHYQLLGVQGNDIIEAVKPYFEQWPTEPNTSVHTSQGNVICLDETTYELWLNIDNAQSLQQSLNNYSALGDEHWDYVRILQNIGEVRINSSELWTPHAINLQETGHGVSFKKGCYTGQEVVARMEYLGKLKRKMYNFNVPGSFGELPNIAAPLYTPEKTQSIGEVVLASHSINNDNPAILSASVTVKHVEEDAVYLDAACEHKLALLTKES